MKCKIYHKMLFIIVLTVALLHGEKLDSLRTELFKAQKNLKSEEIIKIYKAFGAEFHEQRVYDSAFYYYDKALKISKKKTDKLSTYQLIGNVFVDSTNYERAIEYLNKANNINQDVQDLDSFWKVNNLLGMCYGLSNNLDEAIVSFKIALQYAIELNDSSNIGFGYYNIGLANYFKGMYDDAVIYFIQSAEMRETIDDTSTLVTSLTSLGEIFRLKEDYQKSEHYYSRALSFKNSIKNKETLAYLYSEVALVHKTQKNYNRAFAYIDTAMGYCKEIGYKRGVTTLLSYQADTEKELGNIDKAIDLYQETIPGYVDINFDQGVVQSKISLVELYFAKSEYAKAEKYLEEASIVAEKNKLLEESTQIARLKYKVSQALGRNEVALAQLEVFMSLKDSLFNIQKEEKILDIETKYQTAKKEKQIELLDKENQINQQKILSRNYLLLLFASVLIFIVVLAVSQIKRRNIKAELEIEKSRHKLLRSQMNPHFIYNALSAIQNFILQNNPMDSVTYISEFSRVMRRVLESSRNDLIFLDDEIELVESYLSLQKLRFDDRFDFEVKISDKINPEIIKLPPMLSQPFIENAVEHGMKNKKLGEGKITVNYALKNACLIITIEDNGEGINIKYNEHKHKSLATKITKERIENIKKTSKLDILFTIDSSKDTGTKVEIQIPQKKVAL